MMLVLHWSEHAAYGPAVEYLLCAKGMDEVREIADRARLYWGPPDRKSDSITAKNPLFAVAARQPGELLWRLAGETEWRNGADAAAEWRDGDVARVNEVREQAAARRRDRRH